MSFTGLGLGPVLAVLGGFGAAVVVLYFLKLRRRQVLVPFVPLWEAVLAEKQSTRLFAQLKRWLSLLIALAVVAALALALGDPRPDAALRDGRTLVVLLDASASMQATDGAPEGDTSRTRLDVARDRARQLAAELGPEDRMLVAQLDARATPHGPLSGEASVLRDAIDAVEPVDVAANLRAGLRLALDVLRDQPGPEIVLLSDGRLAAGLDLGDDDDAPAEAAAADGAAAAADDAADDAAADGVSPAPLLASDRLAAALAERGVRLSWERFGRDGNNVALGAFAVRRYPLDKSQSEVLVELVNTGPEAAEVELELLGDGQSVEVQALSLASGERLRRFFRNVAGIDARLEARLRRTDGGRDVLPADDRAYAMLPPRRRARVLVVEPGLYLQAALLLDEYLEVTEVTRADYDPEEEPRHDVVIYDSWVPPRPPRIPALYLNPASEDPDRGPFVVTGTVEAPYFDRLDRRHPLLRFTALRDVNVAAALTVELREGDRVLARDDRGPALVVAGRRSGQPFAAFLFDPDASDLPLRVAWPLLLLNAVDFFVQEGAGFVSSFRTGESWALPVPPNATQVVVAGPAGSERRVPVSVGRAVVAGARAGFHTVRGGEGEDAVTLTVAANLGASSESDVLPAEGLTVGSVRADAPSAGSADVRQEPWVWLVLFALLVLTLEWLTYHRRVTV
ncbi:MAG: VWA domain-containing protein [Myxococcota bacterium]